MGEKFIDEARCDECGICQKACPYKAITLDSKPIFDEDKCYGCWACFNRCPTKAIYTSKLRGVGHYRGPTAELKRKLAVRQLDDESIQGISDEVSRQSDPICR